MKNGLIVLLTLLLPSTVLAQAVDLPVPYRYDDVEQWLPRFESKARDAWQLPDRLIQVLHLRPGQAVADLGAGSGYFTRRLAKVVGEQGRVYAVDIELSLLTTLMRRVDREGLDQVIPIFAATHASRLPQSCCDLVLMVNSFHMIPDRVAYLGRLSKLLRPQGRIAVVGWRKDVQGPAHSPGTQYRLTAEDVARDAREAGLERMATHHFLPYQHFQVFSVGR